MKWSSQSYGKRLVQKDPLNEDILHFLDKEHKKNNNVSITQWLLPKEKGRVRRGWTENG